MEVPETMEHRKEQAAVERGEKDLLGIIQEVKRERIRASSSCIAHWASA